MLERGCIFGVLVSYIHIVMACRHSCFFSTQCTPLIGLQNFDIKFEGISGKLDIWREGKMNAILAAFGRKIL